MIWPGMDSALSFQMNDFTARKIPNLPAGIFGSNAPVDIFAKSEKIFVERTDGVQDLASGEQATA